MVFGASELIDEVRAHFARHFSLNAIGRRAIEIYADVLNSRQSQAQ